MRLLLIFLAALYLKGGMAQEKTGIYFYAGSTDKTGNSPITLCRLDPASGEVSTLYAYKDVTAPGYLAFSPDKKYLYSVSWKNKIVAFAVNKDKSLTLLNEQPSEGTNPCYVSVSPSGRLVFSAHYTSGNIIVFPASRDGKLLSATYREQYLGSGPDKPRQAVSHAHCAVPGKDGKSFFVADLGADKIMNYRFDASGKVVPHPLQPSVAVHGGAGPRQIVTTRRHLYLLNEIDATVCAFTIEKNGTLTHIGTYTTLPAGYAGTNSAAAIRMHPNGKYLYISNRGYHAIHGFRVQPDGTLESIGEAREAIDTPRDFNIDPSGHFLLVANLATNDLAVYRIDPATGQMRFVRKSASLSEPSCIEFF